MNAVISLRPKQFATELAKNAEIIHLDVRTPDEFNTGYIEGAINLSYRDDNYKIQVAKLDKNKIYFVSCRAGNRSLEFGKYLVEQGFSRVYHLENGIFSWVNYGNPICQ